LNDRNSYVLEYTECSAYLGEHITIWSHQIRRCYRFPGLWP